MEGRIRAGERQSGWLGRPNGPSVNRNRRQIIFGKEAEILAAAVSGMRGP
jgi:hypothetical protein